MPTEIHGIKFYTVQETADSLGVTSQTIRAWIKDGRLKCQRIGRPIYITEKNILEFLKPSLK
jgi:excisionase family DNA binding protein